MGLWLHGGPAVNVGMISATVSSTSIVHMNRRIRRLRRQQRRHHWQIRGAFSPLSEHDWQGFDAALTQLETAVQSLRERFERVRHLQAQQSQLEEQLQVADLSPDTVTQLHNRLHDLEMQLESHLFDWRSLREPFWQAVRFGGLGIIIGWILHAIAAR